MSEYLTPSLDLFLANDNVKISLTESIRFRNGKNRLRSSIPDFGSRQEVISFLDAQIKLKLQQSTDSVNDVTALTFETFTEGWFALIADLEEVEENVILGLSPNMTEGIVNFDTIAGTVLTRTVLVGLTAGTMGVSCKTS